MENLKKILPQVTSSSFGSSSAKFLKSMLVLGGMAYLGYNSIFQVDGGHRAVMFNRFYGVKDKIYSEGLNFRVPWLEWPIDYEIRTKATKITSPTGTKDLQTVDIGLRVLYKPDESQLPTLYKRLGTDFANRILPSIVNETLKSVVAMHDASQLITQREEVSNLIRRNLKARAEQFQILLDDVSIIHIAFSPQYTQAVEDKQIAQQEAERARYEVEKALQDKRSAIIKAEGDAKSAFMIGNAIKNNPGFVELRRLQAAQEIAHQVSNSPNRMYLDADSLLLNLLKESGATKRISSFKK